jgi:sterol 3beta-glucosyltransferase
LEVVVSNISITRKNIHDLIFELLGDVQPYVALGQQLVKDGHRVRIATHETFKEFVTGAGLEFFSIGGDPQDLMNYMVKSELSMHSKLEDHHHSYLLQYPDPGLMPGFQSLTNGDILKKREMLTEVHPNNHPII